MLDFGFFCNNPIIESLTFFQTIFSSQDDVVRITGVSKENPPICRSTRCGLESWIETIQVTWGGIFASKSQGSTLIYQRETVKTPTSLGRRRLCKIAGKINPTYLRMGCSSPTCTIILPWICMDMIHLTLEMTHK